MAKKPVVDLKLISEDSRNITQQVFNDFILNIIKTECQVPAYQSLKVYTMGSLSYEGLCPYSDIDLLVVGSKDLTEAFSQTLGEKLFGVKIKWWPHLDFDLSADIFDHISLFFAQAILKTHEAELLEFKNTQYLWILKNQKQFQEELLNDRTLRKARYGTYGGELAPNIKYGAGGLRDTCQAMAWAHWELQRGCEKLNERISKDLEDETGVQLLEELILSLIAGLKSLYKVRFALQIKGLSDQMSAEIWPELIEFLRWSFKDKQSFYNILFQQYNFTELVFERGPLNTQASLYENLKSAFSHFVIEDFECSKLSFVNVHNYRACAYIISKYVMGTSDRKDEIFHGLQDLFLKPNKDWEIDFLIDSSFFKELLEGWDHISGLTQSSHYHKYTVSEHLRHTLKAVCHLQTNQDLRFSMNTSCEDLSEQDWKILKWVAIFHDLKKGFPEDHSLLGKEAVFDFSFFSEEEKQVIGFLVEHHLKLSNFAFRFEHSDKEQLQKLNELFEVSLWIRMLLVFTGADIMGSNPQAWNKWKSDQLYYAYKALMDYRNKEINSDVVLVEGFELATYLVNVIGYELLKEDLILIKETHRASNKTLFRKDVHKKNDEAEEIQNENMDILVESIDENLWVRVYQKDYGPGTLGHILNLLYLTGLPVEQAFIATDQKGQYVYDWFRLPSTFKKPKKQIQARLKLLLKKSSFETKHLKATIDKVIFLTENKDKLSFLFKGQDQNGVLLYISKIFETLGVNILKAQINTWGHRIEDLFVVKKESHNPDELLEKLKESLKKPQSIKY